MDQVIRFQQRSRTLLDTIQDSVWPELESEVRALAEEQTPTKPITERYQYLHKYPLVGAAIIDFSAFYHSAHGAADVLNAYVTREPTASEWHIHMANMSNTTLMETDENVVRNSVAFMMYKRGHHPEELKHSFAKARQEVDQALGEHATVINPRLNRDAPTPAVSHGRTAPAGGDPRRAVLRTQRHQVPAPAEIKPYPTLALV